MFRARGNSGGRRRSWLAALAGIALAGSLAPASGAAAMTREEAAIIIQSRFGVEILRVRAGAIDGRPVWLVTVMKPGADTNDAFQVTTLAVEQETGLLVPAFRHGPNGPVEPSQSLREGKAEQRPSSMHSGTWR